MPPVDTLDTETGLVGRPELLGAIRPGMSEDTDGVSGRDAVALASNRLPGRRGLGLEWVHTRFRTFSGGVW